MMRLKLSYTLFSDTQTLRLFQTVGYFRHFFLDTQRFSGVERGVFVMANGGNFPYMDYT